MEHLVVFEEKVCITPKDMNLVSKQGIEAVLLSLLRDKLENKCSQHGYVVPKSLEILSRSMGHIENGRFTGNIIFHVQSQGKVYNPSNGTRIVGRILRKNKMGLYVIYKDAIRILIPRDLHLGNEEFEKLDIDDTIELEIRKSRFQIRDNFILSVGVFIKRTDENETTVKGSSVEDGVVQQTTERASENKDAGQEDASDSGDVSDEVVEGDNEGGAEEDVGELVDTNALT
jgi:DNA-directed RNA polymerase subunit E'/Rpb7